MQRLALPIQVEVVLQRPRKARKGEIEAAHPHQALFVVDVFESPVLHPKIAPPKKF